MLQHYKRPLAVLALLALAACTGNATNAPNGSGLPPAVPPQNGAAILTTIVGVGDSLTAGTQSGTTMGENGTNPNSIFPGHLTPATQENGFFSLLVQQAKGLTPLAMYNPATSPLPLIHQPGIGGQLLPSASGALFTTHSSCDSFTRAAFSLSSALSTNRISATQAITDVGVPGQTVHEALAMVAPLTGAPPPADANGNCSGYPTIAGDPTSGGLQTIVSSESAMFYPVLGGFAPGSTQLSAATSLHPTLATVWLGANDMLKFIFSAGTAPASDPPAQMQADLTQIIQTLQNSGARVVVANIPDILSTPQFFPGGTPNPNPQSFVSQFQSFATRAGVPAPVAATYANALAAQLTTNYKVGTTGALTETGFFAVFLAGITEIQTAQPPLLPNLDQNGPGSGMGTVYIPDTFAAQVRGLNAAYNAAIGAAAAATGAPLVDIKTIFSKIQTLTYPPQFVNPPKCCFLVFGGGLSSFDGLHPTNTGYALIANEFINTINATWGLTIPAVNVSAVYNGTAPYLLPDPYAQH